ncbi:hypothetical protein GHT06_005686 [Daphnia sinensis]|uniref:OB domain-containing protein n=1 Tax=Daphnia sinensis TaxID=1820382 RepID=A0AAD5PMP5_9CRUS|nr:hypothetical protein GHT06_005686 [Daphnia sinensis]
MLRESDSEPENENSLPGCSIQTGTAPLNTPPPVYERIKNLTPQLCKKDIAYFKTNSDQGRPKDVFFRLEDEFGTIKVKAFGEDAEKFYLLIQEGEIYYVQFAKIVAGTKPNNIYPFEYEMIICNKTEVKF